MRDAVPAALPSTVKMRRALRRLARDGGRTSSGFSTPPTTSATPGRRCTAAPWSRNTSARDAGRSSPTSSRRHPDNVIFGSGDIWTVSDIFAMLEVTGVHAVSVARGCIGNPWIFRQAQEMMAGESPALPTLHQQRQALLEHFDLSVALHGEHKASKMMRKFGIKFSAHHPRVDRLKREFIEAAAASPNGSPFWTAGIRSPSRRLPDEHRDACHRASKPLAIRRRPVEAIGRNIVRLV